VFGELTFKLDYYHKEGLPTFMSSFEPLLNSLASLGLLGLHKFLPYRRWFQNELPGTIMERVLSERVRQAPWWSKNAPERLARAHISGRANYLREINAILTLEAVDRLFFKEVIPATSAELEGALRVTI
jgi:asparagine synthase (glutamine-hydrolysing)